jgi:DNA polymerase V
VADRTYICIDLKSYYASVECVRRGLDPLKADLLVADESRSDQTICLAVSPSLKAKGVPSRPRLFEAKQKIKEYEAAHHVKVDPIIAVPRMADYEKTSAHIYSIYLRYVAPEDLHIYSIDECFCDCTKCLHAYEKEAARTGVSPARVMAMTMIRDVLRETGITATVGIGTNLYLAKVAMDIVAKKAPPDENGVRVAELDEESYRLKLWEHTPLTDFWHIGPGKARRLNSAFMFTMGDVARRSQWDEEYFYRTFGVDGEIIVDHAWGVEPVTMEDIKGYKTERTSLSSGQVLPRPYEYGEARLVFGEMADGLCADLFAKGLVTPRCSWYVSYDHKSLEACPDYSGPLSIDFYGRVHPKHSVGTVKLPCAANEPKKVTAALLESFDARADRRLLFRRLGVSADRVSPDEGAFQTSLFEDYEAAERDRRLQRAMHEVRSRYGANAVFRAKNLLEGATALERNGQIGGHRA